jgi:anti-anti-sigma factor
MTTLTRQDDACILAVEGELNRTSVDQFRGLVQQCLDDNAHDFVVDLIECTGVDSAGLEAFTWLSRTCQERLGMAKLCAPSDALEKILEITRLKQQLEVCITLEEALAALK